MKRPSLAFLAFGLALASAGFGEDLVSWGRASDGLQIGIGLSSDPQGTSARILFKNGGTTYRWLLVALLIGGDEPVSRVGLTAISPNGSEFEAYSALLERPLAGRILPVEIGLGFGETHETHIPLKDFFCVLNGERIPLTGLLQRGYSIRATLSTRPEMLTELGHPETPQFQPWFGTLVSGDLSSAK